MPGPVFLASSAAYQRYLQDGETGNIALPAYEQVGIYWLRHLINLRQTFEINDQNEHWNRRLMEI